MTRIRAQDCGYLYFGRRLGFAWDRITDCFVAAGVAYQHCQGYLRIAPDDREIPRPTQCVPNLEFAPGRLTPESRQALYEGLTEMVLAEYPDARVLMRVIDYERPCARELGVENGFDSRTILAYTNRFGDKALLFLARDVVRSDAVAFTTLLEITGVGPGELVPHPIDPHYYASGPMPQASRLGALMAFASRPMP